MWPLPPVRDEQIILSIEPTKITLGCLKKSKRAPLMLYAYASIPIDSPTVTTLNHHLEAFISKYKLDHALISIALAAPLVHEQLVRLHKATPTHNDFITPELKKMIWDYRYLHALDDNQYLFYLSGITRPALFSYKLLAHASQLHLTSISSAYMALLHAYRALFGPAFRQSQLAIDMIRTGYNIEKSLSADSIARLLHIPASLSLDVTVEKKALLTMIGLYYQERI